jgi:polar amino acid transport system substrate-binding protein
MLTEGAEPMKSGSIICNGPPLKNDAFKSYKAFVTTTILKCISLMIAFYLFAIPTISYAATSLGSIDKARVPANQQRELLYDLGLRGGWVPYHSGSVTGTEGFFKELTALISTHSGIKFTSVHFPPKRAEKAMLRGLVDFDFVCLEWFNNGIDKSKYVTSDAFIEIVEYFVTLEQNANSFSGLEDFYGLPVGTISGYFYFDDHKFERIDFLNERQLIQGLKEQRYSSAILERETAKHWAKVTGTKLDLRHIHTQGKLRFRLRIENDDLLPTINKAIKTIKSNGQLQQLFNKYDLESPIL